VGVREVGGSRASSGEVAHLNSVSSSGAHVSAVSDFSRAGRGGADNGVRVQEVLAFSVGETVFWVDVVASLGLSPYGLTSCWLSHRAGKIVGAEPVSVDRLVTESSAHDVTLDVVKTILPSLVVSDVLFDLLGVSYWGYTSLNFPTRLSRSVWLAAEHFLVCGAWGAFVDLWASDVDIDVDITALVVGIRNKWSSNNWLGTVRSLLGQLP